MKELEDLFTECNGVWLEAHNLVDHSRALTHYIGSKHYKDKIPKWIKKCDKLQKWIAELSKEMLDVELSLDEKEANAERQFTRKHNSSSRSTKSRKDSVSKQVSWADLVANNRKRS